MKIGGGYPLGQNGVVNRSGGGSQESDPATPKRPKNKKKKTKKKTKNWLKWVLGFWGG
jgi:hypothetical protein